MSAAPFSIASDHCTFWPAARAQKLRARIDVSDNLTERAHRWRERNHAPFGWRASGLARYNVAADGQRFLLPYYPVSKKSLLRAVPDCCFSPGHHQDGQRRAEENRPPTHETSETLGSWARETGGAIGSHVAPQLRDSAERWRPPLDSGELRGV